ncbi:aminotransferase class IV [Aurantimonas sp. A2-1-M11]|uniref:aminotransferase class IV n=1 Tax=Aurantimonas sp. A2-1-M11 TaxID=3113712 RepID=UPI002F92A9DD
MDEIWINGGFEAPPGAIAANDRGFTLADGVFDTSLVLGGTVFGRTAHLDRLMAAAASLAIPAERAAIEGAMTALATRRGDGAIRLTLTRGPGPRGLTLPASPQPTLLGTSAPLAPAMMFAPLRLQVAAIRRNETSPTARVKSLAYLDSVLANHAAKQAGADEALFLNGAGRVACSALANVFVLSGEEIATPPLDEGVLDGIVRGWVLGHAAEFGLAASERPLTVEDLATGQVFLTNSLRLIAPASLGDRLPDAADPHLVRLMTGLCDAIGDECQVDPRTRGAKLPG